MTSILCAESRTERYLILICLIALCYCLIESFSFSSTKNALPKFCKAEYGTKPILDNATSQPHYESLLSESEYHQRVMQVKQVCHNSFIANLSSLITAHSVTRRRQYKSHYCNAKKCPIIIDEVRNFMFCFIPKVASTEIKHFMLDVSGISVNESFINDSSSLHDFANHALKRISPMKGSSRSSGPFFKAIFVRHPFDRLVSAFRSKAETSRERNPFFYKQYWDKIMRTYRKNYTIDDKSRVTFKEFVRYLIHTSPWYYDDHWSPYWSRCDPCRVDYNFIGKLENASIDFPYAFRKMGINDFPYKWSRRNYSSQHSIALKYFSEIPRAHIIKLYQLYWLDFELFGYTLDGFI